MSGSGWQPGRRRRLSGAITRSIAAAALLCAAAGVCAQPSLVTLENGLKVYTEAGGPYDAVVACFVCPQPAALDEIGRRAVVVAALNAAARQPDGPGHQVAQAGGLLTVEEAGDLIVVAAYGDQGSAPALVRALADLVAARTSAASLVPEGALRTELERTASAGISPRGEAERRLLGAAWCAYPEEIKMAAQSLTPDQLDRIMAEWLSAANGAVSVGGEGPSDELLLPLTAIPPGVREPSPMTRTAGRGEAVVREEQGGQSVVAVAAQGPLPMADEAPAWAVIARLLGAGNSSLLFLELRTIARLTYLTGCNWPVDESCLLWAEVQCDPGRERDVERRLLNLLEDLGRDGPAPADLDRARARTRLELRAVLSSPLRRARLRAAGMAWGDGPLWPEQLIEKIDGVAPEDIRRVALTIASGGLVLRIESGPE